MPEVNLDSDGMPSFSDRRHCYFWMREHGACAMPVAVSAIQAEAVFAFCGTRNRTCWFEPPPVRVPLPAILAGFGLAAAGILAITRF